MRQVGRIVLFASGVSLGCFGATVIDFNDGVNGAAVGALYSGLGVTFSNAQFDGFPCFGVCTDISGLKIVGIGPNYMPMKTNPIVISFSSSVSFVSIYGLNVGANGARMDAYDALIGGTLLGFDEDLSVATGIGHENNPLLSVSAAGIRRVELFQPRFRESEGLLFDTLTFKATATGGGGSPGEVPEPGTFALLAPILGACLLYRRLRA